MVKQAEQSISYGSGGAPAAAGQSSQIRSPISNDAYNVVAALHEKLEGLEAYRKYAGDTESDLWKKLAESDIECVGALVGELERMVSEGRFRTH